MTIKVLGPGCHNCRALERGVREALADLGRDDEVEKVTDVAAIAGYGVLATPALVVREQVLVSGRVPSVDEIRELIAGTPA